MKHCLTLAALFSLSCAASAYAVDERYPAYAPRPALAGTVHVEAAPAPASLLILWGESFHLLQPRTTMSRGGEGVRVRVGIEALAVFVHAENPLSCLSLGALQALHQKDAHWREAGAGEPFGSVPVSPMARMGDFGEVSFFRERVLGGAALPDATVHFPRARQLMKALAAMPGGIAVLPAAYRGSGVKPVELSDGQDCVAPTRTNASRATYPLARFAWLEGSAEGATLAYFDYVLSAQGQRDVVIAGHFMLPYVFAREERHKLGLD